MKPPICSICNERFNPSEGGLIYFVEDEEDVARNKLLREPGFVGHPSNAFWFCGLHIDVAKKYRNLHKKDALKLIREHFQ